MNMLLAGAVSVLLAVAGWPAAATAGQVAVAETGNIAVDTRGSGDVDVSGRIYDVISGMALSGATVGINGRSATTGSDGGYAIGNVLVPPGGAALTAAAPLYNGHSQTLTVPSGVRAVTVPDILLTPTHQSAPVVEWVRPDLTGIIVADFDVRFQVRTRVDWRALPPGLVHLDANRQRIATLTGAGPEYVFNVPADRWFAPSLRVGGNTLVVNATSAAGAEAAPLYREVFYVPSPSFLQGFLIDPTKLRSEGNKLSVEIKLPDPVPYGQLFNLPVIGKFGAEFQWTGAFEYGLSDGIWKAWLGQKAGRDTRGNVGWLQLGDVRVEADASIGLKGLASRKDGIVFTEAAGRVSLAGKIKVAEFLPFAVLPPGASSALERYPKFKEWLSLLKIDLVAKPKIEGTVNCPFNKKDGKPKGTLAGSVAMEAVYEAKNGAFKPKIYAGGEPRAVLQMPGDPFKEVGVKLYLGMEGTLWSKRLTLGKWVLVDWSYQLANSSAVAPTGTRWLAVPQAEAVWEPADLAYLADSPDRFVGDRERLGEARKLGGDSLAQSRLMLARSSAGAVCVPPALRVSRGQVSVGTVSGLAVTNQTDVRLVANVYPDSEPGLAASGNGLLLCYVRPRTNPVNPSQPTEIAWTAYGAHDYWTSPQSLTNPFFDYAAQFAPRVAFYGDGLAICVYQKLKDPDLDATDPEVMAPQMELAWRGYIWNAWGGSIMLQGTLTDNTFLDHEHRLTGPTANGDLFLFWLQNEAGQLTGSGAPGSATNSRIMVQRYRKADGSYGWSEPEVVADQLVGELSLDAAAKGGKAVCIWTRDMDGDLADASDTEVFSRAWDEASATWGPIVRRTADTVADGDAKVAVSTEGTVLPLWRRGTELVMQPDFAGSPLVVRTGATTLGLSDCQWTQGPGGNLVLVWQEMTTQGSDLHCRVYDPASASWSEDALLTQDGASESAPAVAWTGSGNLALAYVDTAITTQVVTVALEGGGAAVVPGVPQPGASDLRFLQRALVKDFAVLPDTVSVTAGSVLPGSEATLRATVQNSGNVAVQDAVVGFYLGNPAGGGTLIQSLTLAGWLRAGEARQVTATWTVPALPGPVAIFGIVDPAGQIPEADEANNAQSQLFGGTDLALSVLWQTVRRDGSASVAVAVQNLGSPAAPVVTLRLRPQTDPGAAPVWSGAIGVLGPGDSVEKSIDLPAGTITETGSDFRLALDEDAFSADTDLANNQAALSLALFVDDDHDGMPAGWEAANGFSDANPVDAAQDADRDGLSNAEESVAGTGPRDPASFLRVTAVSAAPQGTESAFDLTWSSVSNRVYSIERSTTLESWEPVASGLPATPPLNQYKDILPLGGWAYYRVVAR